MTSVLDYSWGRPNLTQVKQAGYAGVLRYLSHDTTGKTISAAEAVSIRQAGLGLGLVFEDKSTEALEGSDAGTADAQFALSLANSIGFPSDRPIYFAVDTQAADAQLAAVDAYFTGVKSVLGARSGIYGDYTVVAHYASLGYTWLWQTLAWSHGAVDNNAQLYQNGASAFSGSCDVDIVQKADWGGWTNGLPTIPTAPSSPVQSTGPGGTYTVVSGDTLIKIGSKLSVDWRALASLNHLSAPYTIYVGEKLSVPGGSTTAEPVPTTGRYTVVSGDTLSGIGTKLGVSWTSIANANGLKSPYTIYPGQVLIIPSAGTPAPAVKTYTVVSGDTLSGIGTKLGISWESIAQLNNIASPYTIYPNEVLRLP